MFKRIVFSALAVTAALCLSGCGGSSKPISLAITSSSMTVDGADTVTLTAAVTNDKNSAGVSWAVSSGGGTLSNQTTTSATYTAPAATASQQTITITATSIAVATQTGAITITVPAVPTVTSTSASLTGAVGTAFSVKLAASGGISPFTWTLGSGTTLPACLTLKSDGTLTTASGVAPTATCAGSYANLTFKATDSGTPNPLTVTSSPLTITITAPSLSFSPTLPGGNVGVAYSGSVAATGVVGTSTYTLASGALPADLSLNASSGAITGTPKASDAGTFPFTIKVVDAYGDTATSGSLSITVTAPTITFSPSLPAGNVGTAYTGSVSASGPVGATTYSLATGSLPSDLSLNASTGAITGTPKASDAGTFPFTVKVVDAYGDTATSGSLSIAIAAPTITFPASLTGGTVGTAYAGSVAATGPAGTTTYTVASGSLPADLSLNSGTGAITGTPKASDVGTATFTIKVVDAYGDTATSNSLSITIAAAPPISFGTAPTATATAGVAYTSSVAATGGAGALTYSISSGSLPAGLNLNTTTGAITGTPTTVGPATFTAQAQDSFGDTPATQSYTITVSAGAATHITVLAPSTATAGVPANFTVTAYDVDNNVATTYTGTVTFTSTDSQAALPASSALVNGTGTFAATLKTAGSQTITATDTGNATITGTTGAITVNPAAAASLVVTAPATATNNVAISFTVTAKDSYNNTATGFADTVQFSSTDGSAVLPANSALINGAGTFAITLKSLGGQTVTATDMNNAAIKGTSGTITVSNNVTITSASIDPLDVGQAATQTLTASGGSGVTADYSWSWTGSIPPGLSLSTAGAITGTPTTAGSYTVSVTVKDTGVSPNQTYSQSFTITINDALTLPASSTLPAGYTGVVYDGTIAAAGGSGNYCYTVPTAAQYSTGIWDGLSTYLPNTSGGSCNFIGSSLLIQGTPTNPPAPPYTISFSMTVVDLTTGASVSRSYHISVTAPTAPSLPSPSTTVPGSATDGQTYTASIVATGGVGPTYTWTVNSTPVSGSLALGASGLSNQFTVSNSGSGTLAISGSPTSTGTVTFTAQVKDNTTGLTSSSQSYSIQVNSAGSTVSGQVLLNSNCGGSSGNQPIFTVSINTTPTATTTTTDSNGNYTFTGIPNGTYTITPSIPGASSSVFYPAAYTGVALDNSTNNNVTGENFNAAVGYTVSGTVTYGGSQTGQTYLVLNNNNCGGNGGPGTSISAATLTSGGAFSIRGVPPGSYTLQAWMDPLGQAAQNKIDPTGTTPVTVTTADVTTAAVIMANPAFATPNSNPALVALPDAGGALIFYQGSSVQDSNGNSVEDANQYMVQWSTSPTLTSTGGSFATVAGSKTFNAIGTKGATLWIMNNTTISGSPFTSSTTYYFQARSFNTLAGTTHPTGWSTYIDGSGNPKGVTIGAALCSSNCTTVSGSVTIPNGVTVAAGAPLYVGFYQQSSNGKGPSAIYAVEITSPVAGANSYSITIPSGSGYTLFGILDQNLDGQVDAGDVTNVRDNGSNGVTVSGSTMAGQNLTLPGVNSTASVTTQYQSSVSSGSTSPSTSYQINLSLREANRLPVAVTLTSGPNLMNPVDMGICTGCGNPQFDYSATIPGGTPSVNDTYNFTVTYSDGHQDTGSTVNGAVTAWDSANGGSSVVGAADLPTNLSPTGTAGAGTTPTFTWTFPSSPSDFSYSFYIYPNNCSGSCSNIWQIPGNNSQSSGFTYAETSGGSGSTGTLTWGVDPISGDNSSPSGPLTSGNSYNWSIQVQDSNGNQAQSQTWYQP